MPTDETLGTWSPSRYTETMLIGAIQNLVAALQDEHPVPAGDSPAVVSVACDQTLDLGQFPLAIRRTYERTNRAFWTIKCDDDDDIDTRGLDQSGALHLLRRFHGLLADKVYQPGARIEAIDIPDSCRLRRKSGVIERVLRVQATLHSPIHDTVRVTPACINGVSDTSLLLGNLITLSKSERNVFARAYRACISMAPTAEFIIHYAHQAPFFLYGIASLMASIYTSLTVRIVVASGQRANAIRATRGLLFPIDSDSTTKTRASGAGIMSIKATVELCASTAARVEISTLDNLDLVVAPVNTQEIWFLDDLGTAPAPVCPAYVCKVVALAISTSPRDITPIAPPPSPATASGDRLQEWITRHSPAQV